MYKDATYKKKFEDLHDWFPLLIEAIKKDLRNEHLKKDPLFIKKFLPSKNIHRVSVEELVDAYRKAVMEEEQGEQLAEFITSRWLLKNSEIYNFFETQLSAINPNFSDIDELSLKDSEALIQLAAQEFGLPRTYLFAVLNSVVFPKECFHNLKTKAAQHRDLALEEAKAEEECRLAKKQQIDFETELARVSEKYEKKLQGLQRKYVCDTDALKRQVAHLQRKLQERGN